MGLVTIPPVSGWKPLQDPKKLRLHHAEPSLPRTKTWGPPGPVMA
jgi:hypothetical protein